MNIPVLAWLLPLIASVLFALGSLMLKEGMAKGAGPIRVVFISNWVLVILWMGFFLIEPSFPQGELWWTPFVAGFARVCGGGCLLTALRIGDVSIQTPMGGLKVVFVAAFAALMGAEALTYAHWGAAVLTLLAIYLLGRSGGSGLHDKKRIARAMVLSAFAALFFALNDVLAARAATTVGVRTYMSYNFFASAAGTLAFIPFFHGRLRDLPKACWPWVLGGTTFLALDVMVLLYAISEYQEATTANILYSARGVWAILLIWGVGHWFHNEEGRKGWGVMGQRLLGAILLLSAIGLVLFV